jgi:NitT/TauT family transport system ATP-binding protein
MEIPALECRGVTKTHRAIDGRPVAALTAIDLAIPAGEFHVIIGPSGCGKSTLLWILGGLTEPTGGSVLVHGRPLTGPAPDRVAIVFQEASLFPWRTLLDNVSFGPEMRGTPKAQRHQEARRYIDLVGLAGSEHKYPHELSGGMQQRAAIAQALVQDPDICLMDEPFGALDEQTRLFMGEWLLGIWARTRKTVVFVTHSLQEAILLSQRVVVMTARPGRIKAGFDVTLSAPRDLGAPGASALRAQLWAAIRDESRRAVEADS